MSTKLQKDSARKKFRSSVSVKDITGHLRDPEYDYKWVAATFAHEGLDRIDRYIDNNWEVEYSKEKVKDDRKNATSQDGTDNDLRSSPVTISTRGGHTMVLMKIKKTDRQANAQKFAARDKAREDASRKLVTKTKDGFKTTSEVDLNNIND